MNARSLRAVTAALFALAISLPTALSAGGNTAGSGERSGFVAPLPASPVISIGAGSSLGTGLSIPSVNAGVGVPSLPAVTIPGAAASNSPEAARLQAQEPGQEQPGALNNGAVQPEASEAQNPQAEQGVERSASAEEAARETAPEAPETALEQARQTDGAAQNVAPETASAEGEKTAADAAFDGAAKRGDLKTRLVAAGRAVGARILFGTVGSVLPPDVSEKVSKASGVPAPKPSEKHDEFGGPKPTGPMNFGQRVKYGFSWGMNLLGISSLLSLTLKPLVDALPWQLHVPAGVLESLGRVELMTKMGPAGIAQALITHPISFLFVQLPMSSFMEEITFRGIQFGVLFLLLAAIRPVAKFLGEKLQPMPDLFGLRSGLQFGLKWAQGASRWAYPVAATYTAVQFAFAHFAAWGANPYLFAMHTALGLGLTYVAYRSRSLVAAGVAHTTFNALPLLAIFAALSLGSVVLAQIFSLGLTVASIGWLFYSWRKHRKDLKLGGGAASFLLVGAILSAASLGLIDGSKTANAGYFKPAAQAVQVYQAQQKEQTPAPQAPKADEKTAGEAPKAADTTGVKTTADGAQALTAGGVLAAQSDQLAELTAKVKPAVAKVIFRTAMGGGSGSGFVVRKEGLLVTNAHVVDAVGIGGTVEVQFADGTSVPGKVVAENTDRDIAFVQLPQKDGGWATVPIGDSKTLKEGHLVLAAGHPLGLPFSASLGVVSGLGGGRGSIYVQQLQTDAAINHGNSGGPLFNMKGEVIAINSAIAAPTAESGNIGIGFSITSEFLTAALAQFDATGNINSSFLGIIVDMSNPVAPPMGVTIEQIRPGSAAEKAGLQPGDRIVGMVHAEKKMLFPPKQALGAIARTLAQTKPKDKLVFVVLRGGAEKTVTVTLGDKK